MDRNNYKMLDIIILLIGRFRKLFFFVFLSCSFYTSIQFQISIEKNGFVSKLIYFNDFDAITPDLSKITPVNFLFESDVASMDEVRDLQIDNSICSYYNSVFESNAIADYSQQLQQPFLGLKRQSHDWLMNSYNSFCNSGASMQYAISKNRNWDLNNIKTYCILT